MQRVLPTMVSFDKVLCENNKRLMEIYSDHLGHLLHIRRHRLTGPMLLLPRLPLQRP
jgi:hypothetical protein